MKTTFGRTFVAYGIILLAALLSVGVFFQLLARNYLSEKTVSDLKNTCSTIAKVAAAYSAEDALNDRNFLIDLSVATNISQTDAVICDPAGRLLLCSDAPLGCEHRGMAITSSAFLQKVLSQEYVVTNGVVDGLYTDDRYVVCTTIRDAVGHVRGIVIVSTPLQDSRTLIKKLSDTYLSVSVLVVLASVVAMTIYTRKHSSPLRDMAKTATAFGHGDLKARATVHPGAPQELQELTLAFNNMAQSLEKSEYQRKEFVANVSHELKTPMTTIGGYVDGILDGTIPSQQQNHYLQIVSDETKRLSRLVRSMLDISRLQEQGEIPEHMKLRFDVTECAGQVLIAFEGKINSKRLQVAVDIPEYPVYTHACQDYITQVIYNLMDNAVKFCPQEGELGLQIRESSKKVYVTVSNSGQTIPHEELPLLFDRFHKLDKSRSENRDGWGLGLYIVKTLVCSHGENISVYSHDGRTEFTFTLPQVN